MVGGMARFLKIERRQSNCKILWTAPAERSADGAFERSAAPADRDASEQLRRALLPAPKWLTLCALGAFCREATPERSQTRGVWFRPQRILSSQKTRKRRPVCERFSPRNTTLSLANAGVRRQSRWQNDGSFAHRRSRSGDSETPFISRGQRPAKYSVSTAKCCSLSSKKTTTNEDVS